MTLTEKRCLTTNDARYSIKEPPSLRITDLSRLQPFVQHLLGVHLVARCQAFENMIELSEIHEEEKARGRGTT
jgi:hypothetical protein